MTPYIFCIYVEALEVNSFQVFLLDNCCKLWRWQLKLSQAQLPFKLASESYILQFSTNCKTCRWLINNGLLALLKRCCSLI